MLCLSLKKESNIKRSLQKKKKLLRSFKKRRMTNRDGDGGGDLKNPFDSAPKRPLMRPFHKVENLSPVFNDSSCEWKKELQKVIVH